MKNLLSLLFLLLPFANASAQYEVSKEEALAKAESFLKRNGANQKTPSRNLNKKETEKLEFVTAATVDGEDCFYAFNRGEGRGFILVSADSRTSDEILAYTDKGDYDYDQLPDAAKYMIDAYIKGIAEMKAQNKEQDKASLSELQAQSDGDIKGYVEPLLGKIEWNQSAPYNDLCPELDGVRCVTGCVATAMAQVMYYHRWPEKGKGSISYEWNGQTLSVTFLVVFRSRE